MSSFVPWWVSIRATARERKPRPRRDATTRRRARVDAREDAATRAGRRGAVQGVVPDVPRRRNARDDAVSASAAGDDGARVVRATGKTPRIARPRRGAVRGRRDAAGRDARRDPARDAARARVDAARATRDGVHRGRLQPSARDARAPREKTLVRRFTRAASRTERAEAARRARRRNERTTRTFLTVLVRTRPMLAERRACSTRAPG